MRVFFSITFGEFAFVPYLYMIIIDVHLNIWSSIVLMSDGVI